jgi:hypothetical protein
MLLPLPLPLQRGGGGGALEGCLSTRLAAIGNLALPTHPGLQVPKALNPFTQAAAALAKGAAGVLHAPQLSTLVLRFTSQPLLASPSQSSNLQGIGCNEWRTQAQSLHAAATEAEIVVRCTQHTAAYPSSQLATVSFLFTQPKVPWRGPTAGPASQPLVVLPSQSKYLQEVLNSRPVTHCQ